MKTHTNDAPLDGSYAIIFTGNNHLQRTNIVPEPSPSKPSEISLPKKDPVAVATAILGVKVSPEKFFVKKRTRAYPHRYSDDFEFDPKTGKPLWTEKITAIRYAQGCPDELYPYKLFRYKNWAAFSILEEKEHQILGVGCCSTGPMQFAQLKDICDIKQKLKEDLEPIGEWSEDLFGLYTAFSIVES